jgi:hypothetical protein
MAQNDHTIETSGLIREYCEEKQTERSHERECGVGVRKREYKEGFATPWEDSPIASQSAPKIGITFIIENAHLWVPTTA